MNKKEEKDLEKYLFLYSVCIFNFKIVLSEKFRNYIFIGRNLQFNTHVCGISLQFFVIFDDFIEINDKQNN